MPYFLEHPKGKVRILGGIPEKASEHKASILGFAQFADEYGLRPRTPYTARVLKAKNYEHVVDGDYEVLVTVTIEGEDSAEVAN